MSAYRLSTSTVKGQLDALLAAGASTERARAEFSAYLVFQMWVGMAGALQTGRVTESQFDRMMTAFWQELGEGASAIDVMSIGTLAYSSVFEWLEARMSRYQVIVATAEPSKANQLIVETFCDFAFDTHPDYDTKYQLKANYELGSLGALDLISGSRIV